MVSLGDVGEQWVLDVTDPGLQTKLTWVSSSFISMGLGSLTVSSMNCASISVCFSIGACSSSAPAGACVA